MGCLLRCSSPVDATILNSDTWTLISGKQIHLNDTLLVHGIVGAGGPLTHFKITWAAIYGGPHTDFVVDSDFSTASIFLMFATANLWTTSAGGCFKFLLAGLSGIGEISFWAKGSTTLQLSV